ncbi:MAG: COG4315 family predicted lipoprotein [Solirubrobacteraceae bacterium]
MKRIYVTLLSIAVVSVFAVAAAQAGRPAAKTSRATKIAVRKTSIGTILVSSSGRTLYEFTKDRLRSNSCVKIKECSAIWPSLTTRGKPTAGPGVKASLLSTITLRGGVKQVTYAGHPLYLYTGDSGPGETGYVGEKEFGGLWYAINAAGHAVK